MKSSQTSIDKQELLQFKWTVSSHLMVHKHLISLEQQSYKSQRFIINLGPISILFSSYSNTIIIQTICYLYLAVINFSYQLFYILFNLSLFIILSFGSLPSVLDIYLLWHIFLINGCEQFGYTYRELFQVISKGG